MIILVLLIASVLLAVHVILAPKVYAVHAARTKDLAEGVAAWKYMPSPTLFYDDMGSRLNRRGKFFGTATRSSMERFGIPAGTDFVGDLLPSGLSLAALLDQVEPNDIVVVRGPDNGTGVELRLRKIHSIEADGKVSFFADPEGEPHTTRNVSDIVSKVTHLVI